MTRFDPPPGPSQATPEGRLVAAAAGLSSQQGWRRRAARIVAFSSLSLGVVVAVGVVVGVVWLFRFS